MQNERRSLIIVFFYVVVMLLMCLFTVNVVQKISNNGSMPTPDDITNNEVANTIYVPVYVGSLPYESDTSTSIESTDAELNFIVKSYKGKIGIFSNNGDLIQVLDVYIKTLPKADREMLEEGIDIKNVDELRDIIEDYIG